MARGRISMHQCRKCGRRIELARGPAERHGVEQGAVYVCSGRSDQRGVYHFGCAPGTRSARGIAIFDDRGEAEERR